MIITIPTTMPIGFHGRNDYNNSNNNANRFSREE
jgi:hypothetical protein